MLTTYQSGVVIKKLSGHPNSENILYVWRDKQFDLQRFIRWLFLSFSLNEFCPGLMPQALNFVYKTSQNKAFKICLQVEAYRPLAIRFSFTEISSAARTPRKTKKPSSTTLLREANKKIKMLEAELGDMRKLIQKLVESDCSQTSDEIDSTDPVKQAEELLSN